MKNDRSHSIGEATSPIDTLVGRSIGRKAEDSLLSDDEISEQELSRSISSGVWFLRFNPPLLEKIYRNHAITRSLRVFRLNGLVGVILYGALGSAIYHLMPATSHRQWLQIYSVGIFMLLITRILSFFRTLDRWFSTYVLLNSVMVVALSVFVTNVVPLGAATALSYVGLSYIMFFIYCFVGQRFPLALIAAWLGGALGVAMTYKVGSEINWEMMNGAYTAASFMGMIMAYGFDRHLRINFLQSYLLKQTLKKSERLAREDALTGLANRRYLNEMLLQEWKRMLRSQQPLAVMMIDIDFFKHYNDGVGHLAGDQCLRQIAQEINALAHRSGELAARYGGEEFVLLFPNMDLEAAQQHAHRLLTKIGYLEIPHPNRPDQEDGIVTFSIGVSACIPQSGMTVDQLLRQADTALYRAKSNGRNRCEIFDENAQQCFT